jgi:hypothetical protein
MKGSGSGIEGEMMLKSTNLLLSVATAAIALTAAPFFASAQDVAPVAHNNVALRVESLNSTPMAPPPRGLYAVNAIHAYSIDSAILTDAYVDGVVLPFAWSALEPQEGQFDWSYVDKLVGQAANNSKAVSLIINAGAQSPSWVYSDGAQAFNFIWSKTFFFPVCSKQRLPVPWDPVFQSKWSTFVDALAARYNSNPTVVSVKMSGLNSVTPEIFLPFATGAKITSGSISCNSNNDVANWQAIGYTPNLAEGAWNQIANAFHDAFPDKPLEVMLIPGGFPPINNEGVVFKATGGQDTEVTDYIITSGISQFGRQFVVQNDGLSATWIWSTEESYANQIDTGYQTVGVLGKNLAATVKLALDGGATYLELYEADILNSANKSTIENAHAQLQ